MLVSSLLLLPAAVRCRCRCELQGRRRGGPRRRERSQGGRGRGGCSEGGGGGADAEEDREGESIGCIRGRSARRRTTIQTTIQTGLVPPRLLQRMAQTTAHGAMELMSTDCLLRIAQWAASRRSRRGVRCPVSPVPTSLLSSLSPVRAAPLCSPLRRFACLRQTPPYGSTCCAHRYFPRLTLRPSAPPPLRPSAPPPFRPSARIASLRVTACHCVSLRVTACHCVPKPSQLPAIRPALTVLRPMRT